MPYVNNDIAEAYPGLSDEEIAALEARIGVVLPDDLATHIAEYDGGYPVKNIIHINDGEKVRLHQFLRVSPPGKNGFEMTFETARVDPGFLPDYLIPFAIDEGGDLFCIHSKLQNIVLFTVDDADDPDSAVTFLADSLEKFINAMTFA